jgi:hypothetical protein
MRLTTAVLSVFALTALIAPAAQAWDEDTCSNNSEINPDGTYVDAAYCASATPLEGKHPELNFDHSVSHFEFTYLMGRCLARGDENSRKLAAADAGADMSSPACGSGAVDTGATYDGEFYYAGYACGYELDEAAATATMPAVPAYSSTLRWKHTDRCRSSRKGDATGVHGHGEFFHYPYWAVSGGTNTLESLKQWAHGTAATLLDPSDATAANCDMASSSGCAFSWPLKHKKNTRSGAVWADLTDINGEPLCEWSTAAEWTMPDPHPSTGGWDTDTGWPLRIGIYLHALGDYHSHSLCQLYSGQPTNDATFTGDIVVPVSDDGPTDHADYEGRCPAEGVSYQVGEEIVTYTQAECFEVCGLSAHDAEYGAVRSSSDATKALCSATKDGLNAVWDEIAGYPYWTTKRDVESTQHIRDQIVDNFASYYDPADRQEYVHSLMTKGGTVDIGATADSPCLCANGVYDWVDKKIVRNGTKSTVIPGFCASPKSIVLATSSTETSTATPSITVAVGGTVRLYAWAPSQRIGSTTPTDLRNVSGSSNWTVAKTAVAKVDNTFGSSKIGTITGVAAGTTTVQVMRLGKASTTVAITVQ